VITQVVEVPHVMLPAGQADSQNPFEQTVQGGDASAPGRVASSGAPPSSPGVGEPASSLPAGSAATVVPSATNP
jgi:hypothetical protein